MMRLVWRLHRFAWDLTGGRIGRRAAGLPVLELVTEGHKSGEPRSILINYVTTPTGPAIAGSNAGAPYDPAWARNLRANPHARMRKDGRWSEVRGRFLEGQEWERVWGQFTEHGGYADYARIAGRPIPLVVLQAADR
jgi:deazaflavin-dependent oxidoreductase (nitroreductase family)